MYARCTAACALSWINPLNRGPAVAPSGERTNRGNAVATLAVAVGLWFLASLLVGFACCRGAGRADKQAGLENADSNETITVHRTMATWVPSINQTRP